MSDAIFTLKALYVPGSPEPSCMDAADSDDNGTMEMSDAIYTLKYLYVPGAPPPPDPGPVNCGSDPTDDALDCQSHPCPASPRFIRGDIDGDLSVTSADADSIWEYLFGSYTPTCLDALDANDSGWIDVEDWFHVDQYINSSGPAPLPPFPSCGTDPTDDELDCASHPCMGGR
jgi:hypothetical protein